MVSSAVSVFLVAPIFLCVCYFANSSRFKIADSSKFYLNFDEKESTERIRPRSEYTVQLRSISHLYLSVYSHQNLISYGPMVMIKIRPATDTLLAASGQNNTKSKVQTQLKTECLFFCTYVHQKLEKFSHLFVASLTITQTAEKSFFEAWIIICANVKKLFHTLEFFFFTA